MKQRFGYGDWVRILPLSVGMKETGEILVKSNEGRVTQDVLSDCTGKLVKLLDISGRYFATPTIRSYYDIARHDHIALSSAVMEKVDMLQAHREVEAKEIQVGDIVEGTALSNLFYNVTNQRMKKGVVWNIHGSTMLLLTFEHEELPNHYMSSDVLGNVYGDLGAAYNTFNVIGHTELIKLKVHCDYVKPRYSGKKYACYGSLGAFLDNFNITMGQLKQRLGYCPITRLFETENIEEFEQAVNTNTSLRIKIIR